MTPERIAELEYMAAESGLPGDGTEILAECVGEIVRLRLWLEKIEGEAAWWDDMEEWSHAALAGEEVPS